MTFDLDYALSILPLLLKATVVTFQATIFGMAFAVVGGLVLAVMRLSGIRPLVVLSGAYIEFVRSTPLLTQLFFLFYILPLYGLTLDAFATGVLGLGLHYSSYTAEVYRGGIQGVPRGQWEAATALNLSTLRTWRLVILPQAIPPVIPALGNYLVSMFKDTPLLATITVLELFGVAIAEAGITFRYLEPMTLVGLIFLALSIPSALLVRGLEKRFGEARMTATEHDHVATLADLVTADDAVSLPAAVPAVRLIDVHKSFGAVHVLRGVNLNVPSGQKIAIIGPSGSGKTTILRLIMTLERLTSGSIEIEGDLLGQKRVGDKLVPDEANLRKVRGKIGMVFQHFNLFPHMTALENVMVGPVHALHLPRDKTRERAVELLRLVGLEEKADVHPRQLSGGQQQRVAIARALAMRPRIMLFDEVTSALDPELVGEVLTVIRNLALETAMTMLIVTHEMKFAADIADRVIFMDHGNIVEDAPPSVLFTNPSHERTRAFLRAVLER